MALVKLSCNRISHVLSQLKIRSFSKIAAAEKHIKKSVFISQSNDIHTNLALEEWMYKNFDFKNHHILLLSKNDPCIVIGKNQNPWSESNVSDLPNIIENGVSFARRSVNCEAQYHDHGCLNLTFFSPSERYNLKQNMDIVGRGIFRQFECRVDAGLGEELLLRSNKQLSSSAAKVGKNNSYHSMSLTVRCNKINRSLALQKDQVNIEMPARKYAPPRNIMNLCEDSPQVTVQSVMKAIGWEFLRTEAFSAKDGGMDVAHQQKGFHMVNPTDNWFPGLNEIRDNYSSWEWCYGQTPKFSVTRAFEVPPDLLHFNTGAAANLTVIMTVENGRISDVNAYVPYEFNSYGLTSEARIIHNLKGKRFTVKAFKDLEDSLGCLLDEKDGFVTVCLKQVMNSA